MKRANVTAEMLMSGRVDGEVPTNAFIFHLSMLQLRLLGRFFGRKSVAKKQKNVAKRGNNSRSTTAKTKRSGKSKTSNVAPIVFRGAENIFGGSSGKRALGGIHPNAHFPVLISAAGNPQASLVAASVMLEPTQKPLLIAIDPISKLPSSGNLDFLIPSVSTMFYVLFYLSGNTPPSFRFAAPSDGLKYNNTKVNGPIAFEKNGKAGKKAIDVYPECMISDDARSMYVRVVFESAVKCADTFTYMIFANQIGDSSPLWYLDPTMTNRR